MSTYSPGHFGANSYARVGLETSVMSASPHELIAMLFQGARRAVRTARIQMENGNIPEKGKLISQAIMIIGGLQQGLNLEQGGEIARRLDELYAYMTRRLLEGNLQNDSARLEEVDGLLATVEEGWTGIKPQVSGHVGSAPLVSAA